VPGHFQSRGILVGSFSSLPDEDCGTQTQTYVSNTNIHELKK